MFGRCWRRSARCWARATRTLTAMGSLARTLRELGKHAEAEAMGGRRWRRFARCWARATRARSRRWATWHARCGASKHAEAEAIFREVLAAQREVLGPRHPKTLETMGSLAVTLGKLGKHAEAEALERVAGGGARGAGPPPPTRAQDDVQLARTLYELGKHAEAEAMEREVLAAEREVLGPRQARSRRCSLAITLRKRASTRGQAIFREVLAAEREASPRHPDTLGRWAAWRGRCGSWASTRRPRRCCRRRWQRSARCWARATRTSLRCTTWRSR